MRFLALLTLLSMAGLAGCLDESGSLIGSDTCPRNPATTVLEVQVPNLSGQARVGPAARHEVPVDLTTNASSQFPWSCVRALEVRLAWTNTPTAGADLYVGIDVPSSDVQVIGHDEQQLVFDGAHEELVLVPFVGTQATGLRDGLVVWIMTDWASLSQSGLSATLTITLLV